MKDVERFIIELRAEPPGRDCYDRDPWYQLRGLLKMALRRFGMRCTRVEVKLGAPAGLATEKALSSQRRGVRVSTTGHPSHYTSEPTNARGGLTP